jgi:hypothetical protein
MKHCDFPVPMLVYQRVLGFGIFSSLQKKTTIFHSKLLMRMGRFPVYVPILMDYKVPHCDITDGSDFGNYPKRDELFNWCRLV